MIQSVSAFFVHTILLLRVGGILNGNSCSDQNFAALNTKAIADVVKDFGFDGLECSILTPAAVTDRVGFYKHFIQMLNVDMGDNVYCDRMAHY